MVRFPRLALSMIAAGALALTAQAAPLIRDAATFETFAIEGVSLDMTPEEAFDRLVADGYAAGPVVSYDDWGPGALNFERGSYSGPQGISSITLGRAHGRLALISQSLNQPGIDVAAEMSQAQSHFGVGADQPDCRINAAGTSGACSVRDQEAPNDATMKYTMTVMPTMILRSISRPKELVETMN